MLFRDKNFAFLECRSIDETTQCMAFDGINFKVGKLAFVPFTQVSYFSFDSISFLMKGYDLNSEIEPITVLHVSFVSNFKVLTYTA